ncbi:hypothetical protein QJS10_CPA01g01913 [Acorus calamus]|uniref:Uncharacterized protein n=1 Tax=Acorus calamus TaxID=4465 RepID=A0AAV9FFK4_ACOCL|nr:hypothetical protein QJS10_CPA01g01913 [Acorus calamus]
MGLMAAEKISFKRKYLVFFTLVHYLKYMEVYPPRWILDSRSHKTLGSKDMVSNTISMALLFSTGVPQGRLCLTSFSEMKNGIDRIDGLLNTMLCGMKFLKLKLEEWE